MKLFNVIVRFIMVATGCLAITACANTQPRENNLNYRSEPPTQSGSPSSNTHEKRLTIQSGEGERLNLPWFIQGPQDWINSN